MTSQELMTLPQAMTDLHGNPRCHACACISGVLPVPEMVPDPERPALCSCSRCEIERIAPELADVPDRVSRFFANVQRMLAASNHHEAKLYASEVAREAGTLALMNVEYKALMVRLLERAPMPALRVRVPARFWDATDGALVYCKVCHKTHAAEPGEEPCGGDGSWIREAP